jgi:hypothetical protein
MRAGAPVLQSDRSTADFRIRRIDAICLPVRRREPAGIVFHDVEISIGRIGCGRHARKLVQRCNPLRGNGVPR